MADINEVLYRDIRHNKDLVKKEDAGDLDMIEGLDNVKEALLRRLITEKGSIIHRPNFGVGIKRYQNAPLTLATQRQLAVDINEQFIQDSRVEEVLGVRIVEDAIIPGMVRILVRVRIKGYSDTEFTFTPFDEGF